jgi:hypothetical protein
MKTEVPLKYLEDNAEKTIEILEHYSTEVGSRDSQLFELLIALRRKHDQQNAYAIVSDLTHAAVCYHDSNQDEQATRCLREAGKVINDAAALLKGFIADAEREITRKPACGDICFCTDCMTRGSRAKKGA